MNAGAGQSLTVTRALAKRIGHKSKAETRRYLEERRKRFMWRQGLTAEELQNWLRNGDANDPW